MAEHYYTVPVVQDRDGLITPDLPAGVSFCCAYGVVSRERVAFVKTTTDLEQWTGRIKRNTEQEITDAMRDMGSRLPVRDPIDRWRIGAVR